MKSGQYFSNNIIKKTLIAFSIFVLILFLYLNLVNFILFHTIMEFSIMTLGIIGSTVGVLTSYKILDNVLSKISPSLFVYTTFIFIHIMAYAGIPVYSGDNASLAASAWIIANMILALGFLISIVDVKGVFSVTIRLIVAFSIGILFFILSLFDVLPQAISNGLVTETFRIFQWIIIAIYILSIVVFLVNKNIRKNTLYKNVFYSLLCMFISELLLYNHFSVEGIIIYLGLSIRFIGFMILMYSIFSINLIKPYNELFKSLYNDNILLKKLTRDNKIYLSRMARSQEIAHVGTWELDLKTNTIWASDEAFRIYGIDITEDNQLPLNVVQDVVNKEDRPRLDLALLNLIQKNFTYNISYSITNMKGEFHYINSVANLKYTDGVPVKVFGVINDITNLKLEQDKLRYTSYHDHLTNVYNRRYFVNQRSALDFSKYFPVSTVILDINGLKIINDSFGHHEGNKVLKKIARILDDNVNKENSFVARIGGDEFAIVFPNTPFEEAEDIIQNIVSIINQESVGNINLSIAYGLSVKNDDSLSFDEVLKQAEDDMYLHKISDSQSVRNKIIEALLKTLYEKDTMSEEHSQRVSNLSYKLAKAANLSDKKASDIKVAGILHDIGKITIANQILNKKGKLTDTEYDIIKIHPEKGYKIIHSIGGLDIIANYVLQHHEKFDGTGYPKGLKSNDISYESRIICIADAYDAMTSYRSYKDKLSKKQAVSELTRCKGTHFDPGLVDIFIKDVLNDE